MRATLLSLAALGAVCVGASLSVPAPAVAAPEPSAVPVRWELTVQPGPLRVATIEVEDVGPRSFFYMTYKVVNNSGEDLYFAPTFELTTDAGDRFRNGENVPLKVTEALIERVANPFVQDQIAIIGTLSQGEENAREGLVVWPAENLKVDEVTVYASGFSGETRRIVKPDAPAGEDGKPQEVVLRKTLMLVHTTPGQLTGLGNRPLDRTVNRWILR
ncbi:MAG: hypothetical protein IBJ10_08960 [Phycisphaerales bacterium]|nr:hypothetical protein [Phycisphaerales bacterium]